MDEFLSIGGWAMLLTQGPIVAALINFVERLEDPEYEKKVFKKTIWGK